jgi:hypothetical protein
MRIRSFINIAGSIEKLERIMATILEIKDEFRDDIRKPWLITSEPTL